MLATERLLEIEEKFGEVVERIVPISEQHAAYRIRTKGKNR
jgi:hypothetical protein